MKKTITSLIFLATLILVFFLFFKEKRDFKISYYFWENSYKQSDVKDKLYIKVLDIKYSNKLEIIKTKFIETPPENFVPAMFITNRTLQKIDSKELLEAVLKALDSLNISYDELQIDSDWSDSTRERFFLFLKELKKSTNKTISATIRLHQIKYFEKTGVPPIDYGVLMYYNMSNLGDFNTKNYILDNNIAKKYLYNFDVYPLKLKLALPLYSQAIQFRNKRAINLFEGIKKEDFNENFEDLGDNRFQVLKSHYFKGQYIYKNDILRFDYVTYKDLEIALNDFLKYSKNYFNEIIFYTYKYKNSYNLPKLLNIKGEL